MQVIKVQLPAKIKSENYKCEATSAKKENKVCGRIVHVKVVVINDLKAK